MSHFLRAAECEVERMLGSPRALVTVEVVKDAKTEVVLQIQEDSLGVARRDTKLMPLPDRAKVVGPDGKRVKPSKGSKFWVTSETIDPFHGVLELPNDWRFF